MTIKQRLTDEMKEAMRNKNKGTLATIRLLIDRIQKKEKDALRDLTEEEAVQVLQTFKKQVREEADAFANAGKFSREAELVDSIFLVDRFLPQQMSKEEIDIQVQLVISEITSNGQVPNKGLVMKNLMPLVKGKADNKLVNEVVTETLA
ncbi:GatB/YqeY domain-containing protein [Paenibacillus sp. Mc5Re-14]|uniref:GatB/YqeY domain-containing protein n=1 Tax=Paenibacillus sp. Mc5Re-14 TaxID=1030529 RepID=UPI000ADA16A8|nr:GatB/YqeY domain-containing protein [Paenibacillus sp. Mc5Re-14]